MTIHELRFPEPEAGPTRAAIYVRLAAPWESREKLERRVALELEACRLFARRQGWIVLGEFVDRSRRPAEDLAFAELLERTEAGEVDVLLCADIQHLTRAQPELWRWLEIAERRGLQIVSAAEGRLPVRAAVTA